MATDNDFQTVIDDPDLEGWTRYFDNRTTRRGHYPDDLPIDPAESTVECWSRTRLLGRWPDDRGRAGRGERLLAARRTGDAGRRHALEPAGVAPAG